MCPHLWREIREQAIIGGHYKVGYRCELCGSFVGVNSLTPTGIEGEISSKVELVGVHGGRIDTASGKPCKKQVYDKDTGELETT